MRHRWAAVTRAVDGSITGRQTFWRRRSAARYARQLDDAPIRTALSPLHPENKPMWKTTVERVQREEATR